MKATLKLKELIKEILSEEPTTVLDEKDIDVLGEEEDYRKIIGNYNDRIRKLSDKIAKSDNPSVKMNLAKIRARAQENLNKLLKNLKNK